MKTLKHTTLIIIGILFIFETLSCKKKDTGMKISMEILTDRTWYLRARIIYDENGNRIIGHKLNSIYTFFSDGSFRKDNQPGQYTLTPGNPLMIHIHQTDYKISVLNDTEMEWEQQIPGEGSNKFIFQR